MTIKPIIFIISGTMQQYRDWVKEKQIDSANYVYVSGPESVKGHTNPKGVFVGTWSDRSDIKDIVKTLVFSYQNLDVPEPLLKIWQDVISNHTYSVGDFRANPQTGMAEIYTPTGWQKLKE